MGRRPVPTTDYVTSSLLKMDQLETLAKDMTKSAYERRKYRAQKYAFKKRIESKVRKERQSEWDKSQVTWNFQ